MLIFFKFNFLSAQQTPYTIIGNIFNAEQKPIDIGNVLALSKIDSSMIKGNVFFDGKMRIEGLKEKEFLLKITSLGLKDTIFLVKNTDGDTLIKLNLYMTSDNTLSEIQIVAKTPMFESDGEKIKVNVEYTSLSASGSILDILRKSPGILVSSTDNVSVFARGNALIYLDGQLIASNDVLKSISSSEIKTIEIINNPSSKYDAAGRAVINIITKKNSLFGYNGNLIQNLVYGKYLMSYSGLRLNYKKNRHSINVSYGIQLGKVWSSDEYLRKFNSNDSTEISMNNNIFETRQNNSVHNLKLGYAFALDSNTNFAAQYIGFYDEKGINTDNNNTINQNQIPVYTLQTASKANPILINHSGNVNLTRKLDTLGSELFVALQYTDFSSRIQTRITQNYNGSYNIQQEKRNLNSNDIKIYTAQIDFDKKLSKVLNINLGFKDSYTAKTGNINFDNYSQNGGWISDPSYYNGFLYNENILAGYSELKFKKNKLNIRAGVRGEQTYSNGFSKKINQTVIDRHYFNLFPNAHFGYDFTPDLTAGLTYSNRITRPVFQDMDPFINYIDSLSSFRGNPYLLPEYTQSSEASLIYMKEASITFGYTRNKGALKLIVDKLNDGTDAFIATTKNIDKSEIYSAGITIPYELKWWTTSNYFGYSLNSFTYNNGLTTVKNSKPLFYMYLYNEFRFKKIFSLEITYEYTSSTVDGIFVTKPYSMLSATIRKSFLKDKLICRLVANDILSSYIMAGSSNVNGYDVTFKSRSNSHIYVVSLNYKFGKLKANTKDNSINTSETDRIKMGK